MLVDGLTDELRTRDAIRSNRRGSDAAGLDTSSMHIQAQRGGNLSPGGMHGTRVGGNQDEFRRQLRRP